LVKSVNYSSVESWGLKNKDSSYLCWVSFSDDDSQQKINMAKLPDEIVDVYPLSSGFLIQSQTPDNSINSIYLDIATKQTSQVPDLSIRLINFVPLENNFFIYKSSQGKFMIGKFENNLIQLNELQEIQDGVHRFDALEDDQVMVTTEKYETTEEGEVIPVQVRGEIFALNDLS